MQIRLIALALLLTAACASQSWDRGAQQEKPRPIKGGIAEFQLTYYDGYDLRGRLRVGATEDSFEIDRRMVQDTNVELKKIRACGKPGEYGHFTVDYIIGDPRPEDIITLHKGSWHESKISFFLWNERETGIGPDCFDAELVVLGLGGATAVTLPIHVERTHNPPIAPRGGAPARPIPSSLDGGVPCSIR